MQVVATDSAREAAGDDVELCSAHYSVLNVLQILHLLHYTTLHYTALHYTTLLYYTTTLHYSSILHYTTLLLATYTTLLYIYSYTTTKDLLGCLQSYLKSP